MGIAIPQLAPASEDRASGAQVIDGSLKFDQSKSQHLTRTFSAGNRRIWTHSSWVKRGDFGRKESFFMVGPSSGLSNTNYLSLDFDDNDNLRYAAGGENFKVTTAKFRDTGWYHVVWACDTTQAAAVDRTKIYVNGELITAYGTSSSNPTENQELAYNENNVVHRIGTSTPYNNDREWDGSMSQVTFIDGLVLGPGYFGYTDPLTNTWRPKKFRAEGTTINDGTVWSNSISGTDEGGWSKSQSFSGVLSNSSRASSGNSLTWTPSTPIPIKHSLRIYCRKYGSGSSVLTVNGTDYTSLLTGSETFITIPESSITTVVWSNVNGNSDSVDIGGFEVDGVIMVDSITQNLDFGTNGFYLPMDGNSPIGEDKSGKGNNWTPVNFGSSVALDKATGALPILNTVSGGNYATVGVRTDANAANLVLAVPLVGSATDVSNSINSGTTTKTITVSGDPTASSTQGNFYGGSYYFDGNGDYLEVDTPVLGSGDWTIEEWFKQEPGTAMQNYWDVSLGVNGDSNVENAASIFHSTGAGGFAAGEVAFISHASGAGGGSSYRIYGGHDLRDGYWHHVVVEKYNNQVTLYVDGVAKDTHADTANYDSTSNTRIGTSNLAQSNYFEGYIQDVRVYVGVAKYTSNFIPASTSPDILPDTPSGVSGGSKLTKITDGAVNFSASGDKLTVSNSSGDFDFGSGDFTIESYLYMTAQTDGDAIISLYNYGANRRAWNYYYNKTTNTFRLFVSTNGSGQILRLESSGPVSLNKWTHVAVTKASNVYRMFFDGVQVGTTTVSETIFGTGTTADSVGIGDYAHTNAEPYSGLISNIRIIKGTALYTSNFTPPTAPLTNVTNTKLLCCQSNTLAGTAAVSPNLGGINDGTVWSSGCTISSGGANGGNILSNAFDGSTSNAFEGDTSGATVTVPVSATISAGGVRVYAAVTSGNPLVVLIKNGGTTVETINGAINGGQYYASSSYAGPITSLVISRTGRAPEFNAIEIGGTVLTDPVKRVGNAAAITFNPFTTDINAVRGQESGYATLNPLSAGSRVTLSNGNLDLASTAASGQAATMETYATFTATSGKFYAEVTNSSNRTIALGTGTYTGSKVEIYSGGVNNSIGGSASGSGASFGTSDLMAVAVDFTNKNVYFYKNNILIYSVTGYTVTKDLFFSDRVNGSGSAGTSSWNFGQKPFKFPPPAGFQPLNAANVRPETVIARPDQFVSATIWSGDSSGSGGTTRLIETQHQPDFVWIKQRNQAYSTGHQLYDSVRGAGAEKELNSSSNAIEGAGNIQTYGWVNSFDKTGFTTKGGSSGYDYVNESGVNYVAWSWKAGGNKNTFNVDDVGYVNASDVNMSVGAFDSSVYNTGSYVSQITGVDYSWAGSATNGMFDGLNNKIRAAGSGTSFTWNTSIAVSTLRVKVHNEGGHNGNGGTFTVTDSNGTRAFSVPNSTNADVTNGVLQFTNVPVSGTLTQIVCNGGTGGYQSGIGMVEINGKVLVDSGVTPPNVPSIAATGCSVGTKQGFSIISWTGNETAGATIPHGLGKTPGFAIFKSRETELDWGTYHQSLGATERVILNSGATASADSNAFNNTEPTSSIITLGASDAYNDDKKMIAYVWCDVPGLQKFGSYVGNGDPDGTFVELGFRPVLLWVKRVTPTGSEGWPIYDSSRGPINPNPKGIYANSNIAENDASGRYKDFLSNGFKIRGVSGEQNTSGITYIYCAWAEAPAFNLYGAQSNAR